MSLKIKNFFCLISKPRKLIIFGFLFLIVSGVVLPQLVLAEEERSLFWKFVDPFNVLGTAEKLGTSIGKAVGEITDSFFKAIIYSGGLIQIIFTGTLVGISSAILKWAISPGFVNVSFTGTDNTMVIAGWTTIRDLANMFIVLGFVIVGIATALRIREYQAQKTLVPLIIVALLVNFSLMFTGIIIDGSNIIMDHFLKSGGVVATSFGQTLQKQVALYVDNPMAKSYTQLFGLSVGFAFVNIIMSFILLILGFLFIIRYVALWVLVILSPLAFVFYIFNFTKKYFDMWWNNFLKWCLVGIPAAFFLWLADKMVTDKMISTEGIDIPLFTYLIPGFMLMIGIMVSMQAGAAGAGIIRKGVAAVTKGGKALAKKGGRRLRETGTGKAVEKGITRAAERARLTRPGTFDQQQAKTREDTVKRMEAIQDSDRLHKITEQRGRSRMERMSALEALRKRKDLKAGEYSKHHQSLDSLGFKTSDFDKAMPNEAKLEAGETQFDATSRIVQGMSSKEFRNNVQREAYSPEVFAAMTSQQVGAIGKGGPKVNRDKLVDLAKGAGVTDLTNLHNDLVARGKTREAQQLVSNWTKIHTDSNFS